MDFELSDDQVALKDAATELLDDLADSQRARAAAEAGGLDAELWRAMSAQGWTGIELSEAQGGLGLGTVEAAVLAEATGRHMAPAPFLPTLLSLGALARAATSGVSEARQWIQPLLSGESIGCVAWSSHSAGRGITASEAGDSWTLSGRSDPVIAAPIAHVAIVMADDTNGRALFAVDLEATGRPAAEPAMDMTRSLGWLTFDDTPAVRLGGADAAEALIDRAAVSTSAEMLGGASWALDAAVAYAKDRVQFDRPIGGFQAVKHRCADMFVDVEAMRSVVYWAAWCVSTDDPEASVAASSAKVWCSDAAKRVHASALQVHGGIGFTWEHDVHLYLKRSQLDQVSFGDARFHRERLAELLRQRVKTGESAF